MNTKEHQIIRGLIGKPVEDMTLDGDACFRVTIDGHTIAITEKYSAIAVCITEPPELFTVSYTVAGVCSAQVNLDEAAADELVDKLSQAEGVSDITKEKQ